VTTTSHEKCYYKTFGYYIYKLASASKEAAAPKSHNHEREIIHGRSVRSTKLLALLPEQEGSITNPDCCQGTGT
jgi:hypothetical protein